MHNHVANRHGKLVCIQWREKYEAASGVTCAAHHAHTSKVSHACSPSAKRNKACKSLCHRSVKMDFVSSLMWFDQAGCHAPGWKDGVLSRTQSWFTDTSLVEWHHKKRCNFSRPWCCCSLTSSGEGILTNCILSLSGDEKKRTVVKPAINFPQVEPTRLSRKRMVRVGAPR